MMIGWEKEKNPVPSRFLSAHFIFTDGIFNRDVQYDPSLYFHGEEITMAVRAFTWGYDLLAPHKVVCWHHYGRDFDVIGNRKVLNYDRQRKSEEAVIEIALTNNRTESVDILLIEHINGDWIIKDESLNYKKEDASTIHFVFSVQAGETKSVYYTYRKEWK